MAVSIAKLAIGISANTQGLTQGLSQAQGAVSGFGGSISSMAKQFAGSMAGQVAIGQLLADTIKGITNQVIALGKQGFQFMVQQVKEAFTEIDEMAKLSDRLGVSMESLAGLQLGAELSGVTGLDTAMEKFADTLSDAKMGAGEGAKSLRQLGLNAQALINMEPDQAIGKVADAMQGLAKADQVRVARDLFGRGGSEMVNLLQQGSAGIESMKARAEELGLAVSRVDAAKVEMANDAITEFWASIKGVARSLAVELAPFVTAIAEQLTGAIASLDEKSLAQGLISTIETVSIGIASAIDLIEGLGLAAGTTLMDLAAQILFEIETVMKGVKAVNDMLPKFAQDPTVDATLAAVTKMQRSSDSILAQMEARAANLEIKPRAESVKAFFEDTRKRMQENAEKMAAAGEGAGAVIGDNIYTGFQRGLQALEFGSKEAFSAIVNAISGGVQARAAVAAVEAKAMENLGMGGEVADMDLAAAGAGLRAQLPDEFAAGLENTFAKGSAIGGDKNAPPPEEKQYWDQSLTALQALLISIQGQTKLAPANL